MPSSNRGGLLREATDSFSAVEDPVGYVNLNAKLTDPKLSVSISGLAVTYANLIEKTDIQAYADNAAASLEAKLSGCSLKTFGYNWDLQKMFSDWYSHVTVFDGKFAYKTMNDDASTEVGDKIKNAAIAKGFNSRIAAHEGYLAALTTKDYINQKDPFPGTVTDSVIKESDTFAWSVNWQTRIQSKGGTITINEHPPGWPEFRPPSPSQWIKDVNQRGGFASGEIFAFRSGSSTLNEIGRAHV
jgi:hypothetical protein